MRTRFARPSDDDNMMMSCVMACGGGGGVREAQLLLRECLLLLIAGQITSLSPASVTDCMVFSHFLENVMCASLPTLVTYGVRSWLTA